MNVGYARVSLESENIKKYIEEFKKVDPMMKIFSDEGVSGSIPPKKRPGFSALFKFVETHDVEAIYIFEFSRLGRGMFESIEMAVELEKMAPIYSMSPRETFLNDVKNKEMRHVVFTLLAYIVDMERKNTIERTKMALKNIRDEIDKKGFHMTKSGEKITYLGRKKIDIDWDRVEKLKASGLSLMEIAKAMDLNYGTLAVKISQRKKNVGVK